MYNNTGLVLEGGGMRGCYTAGVLDFFIEKGLEFSHVYGVSAGAIIGANYIGGQLHRGFRTLTDYIGNKDYHGVGQWLKHGDFYNVDFAYNKIPNQLDPADYEGYRNSPMKFYSVIANIETGKAEYYHITDIEKEMHYMRASASLPLISHPVQLDGKKYLDGGICDSIPLAKSLSDGNGKNVVILTQHRGFVKQPSNNKYAAKIVYRNYPNFVNAMANRHNMYNSELELVYNEEEKGTTFVIQPESPVAIARLEKDISKLKDLYDIGYNQAKEMYPALVEFLEK